VIVLCSLSEALISDITSQSRSPNSINIIVTIKVCIDRGMSPLINIRSAQGNKNPILVIADILKLKRHESDYSDMIVKYV
jgi:hypothetical protein